MAGETGSAREEAERLVATVLAMAQQGGRRSGADRDDDSITGTGARLVDGLGTLGDTLAGMVGHLAGTAAGQRSAGQPPTEEKPPGEQPPVRYGWSTGSVECCVCPICRTMATLRNPTPESAARLAGGAGDFATGVASLMRAVSAMSGTRPRPARRDRPAPPPPDPDLAWSAATRTGRGGPPVDADPAPDEDGAPWAAATRAAAREQERRDAEAREQKQREAEARRQKQREAGARARAGDDIDRGGSASSPGPRTARGAGIGDDVWAAATADGPAMDHDDAGDDARSGEV
jgi:hypothetical protein